MTTVKQAGRKGGKARAAALTAEERSAIAKKGGQAAKARREAAKRVLAMAPDAVALVRDLKADGTGRGRCFIAAVEAYEATFGGEK